MMKVIFKTELDRYKMDCFPKKLEIPPRVGEFVHVTKVFEFYFANKKLPLRLEVVHVTWFEDCVVCGLNYNDHDVRFALGSGADCY